MSVYFIRNKATGNIKIGFTKGNPLVRLDYLQVGCDGELELIGVMPRGTATTEHKLHKAFRSLTVRGEWFKNEGKLAKAIKSMTDRGKIDQPGEPLHRLGILRFLDVANVCVKQRRSKLIMDLYELSTQAKSTRGRVSMKSWADVRKHENKAASLRDLYRMKDLLASYGCSLVFGDVDGAFEIDLSDSSLQALIAGGIDEASAFLEGDRNASFIEEDAENKSGVCLKCGEALRLPMEELLSKRSHEGAMVPTRELRKTYHIGHRRLKRLLLASGREIKPGRQRVESIRPKEDVVKAEVIARGKAAFKVKVIDIADLLDCSHRTAARFIQRVRGGRVSSDRRK